VAKAYCRTESREEEGGECKGGIATVVKKEKGEKPAGFLGCLRFRTGIYSLGGDRRTQTWEARIGPGRKKKVGKEHPRERGKR